MFSYVVIILAQSNRRKYQQNALILLVRFFLQTHFACNFSVACAEFDLLWLERNLQPLMMVLNYFLCHKAHSQHYWSKNEGYDEKTAAI